MALEVGVVEDAIVVEVDGGALGLAAAAAVPEPPPVAARPTVVLVTSGGGGYLRAHGFDSTAPRRLLDARASAAGLPAAAEHGRSAGDAVRIHGFALVEGQLVGATSGVPQDPDSRASVLAALRSNPGSEALFLVRSLASFRLDRAGGDAGVCPAFAAPVAEFTRYAEGVAARLSLPLVRDGEHFASGLDLVRRWRQEHRGRPGVMRWDTDALVAELLVLGRWRFDARAFRVADRQACAPALLLTSHRNVHVFGPTRRVLAAFFAASRGRPELEGPPEPELPPVDLAPAVAEAVRPRFRIWRPGRDGTSRFAKRYEEIFLLDCVAASQNARNLRAARASADAWLAAAFGEMAPMLEEARRERGWSWPSGEVPRRLAATGVHFGPLASLPCSCVSASCRGFRVFDVRVAGALRARPGAGGRGSGARVPALSSNLGPAPLAFRPEIQRV